MIRNPPDHHRFGKANPAAEAACVAVIERAFRSISDVTGCLLPLLSALGWRGSARRLAEALPHFAETLDVEGLRAVLARLGFASEGGRRSLQAIPEDDLPCLFVPDKGAPLVLWREDSLTRLYDGASGQSATLNNLRGSGIAYSFAPADEETSPPEGFFRHVLRRFRPQLNGAALLTAALYLLSLLTPLFVLFVFDRMGPRPDAGAALLVALGIAVAIAGEVGLRALRGRLLAHIGARAALLILPAVFQQNLRLPPAVAESAKLGRQMARLREYDALRDALAGNLAMTLLEAPFQLIVIIAIAWVAGWLALVPILAGIAYMLVARLLKEQVRTRVSAAGRARAIQQEFMVELLSQMRPIKAAAAEPVWLERFRQLSNRAVGAGFETNAITALSGAIGQGTLLFAALFTLVLGARQIADGTLSVGALVVALLLGGRVIAALQTSFGALSRLEAMRASIISLDSLMRMQIEKHNKLLFERPRHAGGASVEFDRLVLGYDGAEPVLRNVSLTVAPGEIIAITGPNGAGKSSILKALLGLYPAVSGTIRIDGVAVTEADPVVWRQGIAYLPQESALFFGTVAQNLRLVDPSASDERLVAACEVAGVSKRILSMTDGFEAKVGDTRSARLPDSFRHGLGLARCLLRQAPLFVMDEAIDRLDGDGDRAFADLLQRLRGRATVIYVTHRPSHMKMADRVCVIEGGVLRFNGTPAEILPILPKKFL